MFFLESGHGKGPSDGVSSAVKRGCDSDVARGCPIRTIQDIRNSLDNRDSKVLNHAVTTDAIDECENILKDITVPKIPGIAETHFIRVSNDCIRNSNLYCTQCNPAWNPCACMSFKNIQQFFKDDIPTTSPHPEPSSAEPSNPLPEQSTPIVSELQDRHSSAAVVDSDDDSMPRFEEDDWIIVNYENAWYPGKVVGIADDSATVKCLEFV